MDDQRVSLSSIQRCIHFKLLLNPGFPPATKHGRNHHTRYCRRHIVGGGRASDRSKRTTTMATLTVADASVDEAILRDVHQKTSYQHCKTRTACMISQETQNGGSTRYYAHVEGNGHPGPSLGIHYYGDWFRRLSGRLLLTQRNHMCGQGRLLQGRLPSSTGFADGQRTFAGVGILTTKYVQLECQLHAFLPGTPYSWGVVQAGKRQWLCEHMQKSKVRIPYN